MLGSGGEVLGGGGEGGLEGEEMCGVRLMEGPGEGMGEVEGPEVCCSVTAA